MVPIFRSPRLVLGAVAAIEIARGITQICFLHELCKALAIPRPDSRLAFQIWGAIEIVLGLSLIAIARRPMRHRSVLLLILACKLAAGATCLGVTIVQPLPASLALVAILFEFAPAAAIVGVLSQIALPSNFTPSPRHRRLGFWGSIPQISTALTPFLLALVLAASAGSFPLIELGRRRGWLPSLSLVVVTPNSPNLRLKDKPWAPLPSQFPITPGTGLEYQLAPALGDLKFTDPVSLIELPDGTGRKLVAERTGRVFAIGGRNSFEKKLFLDLRAIIHYGPYSPEEGLLSIALHPGYANPMSPGFRSLFVFFTRMWEGRSCNCVARFQVTADSDSVDAASEKILFCQGYALQVHHGGGIAFGPDGFLYIGVGDGFWGAPNEHAQRIDKGFFSGILRVDVDQRGGDVSHPIRRPPQNGFSSNYFVPNDNPFLSENGEQLEEFFAIGFRNPWRISFDRKTGDLWVADSGFEKREEINRVAKGDNGGWAYLEGSVPTQTINEKHLPRPDKPLGREIAPVHEYSRGVSYCTVGGFVYRGKQLPELQGKFVFGDVSGQIWALTLDEAGQCQKKTPIGCVPQPLMAVCSLAEDADGELLILATKEISKEEGSVYKIVRGPVDDTKKLPKKLSETGLFTNVKSLTPHSALTPYEINVPFWSDHAIKSRFVGTQSKLPIRAQPSYPFKIPSGTIFVKHFDFPTDLRRPDKTRPLETRVLVFTLDQKWYGLSYRWNTSGTDAVLLEEEVTETLQVIQKDGSVRPQTWTYPDRHACLSCHNAVTEGALGFSYRQLWNENRISGSAKKATNQLKRLRDRGILAAEVLACDLSTVPRLAGHDDATRSLEDRARSYLDANCSYCHRNGVWYSTFDLRYDTPLNQSQLFNEPLLKHFSDWTNGNPVSHSNPAMAITRGAPEDSFVLRRMNSAEEGRRMPPIGRSVIDEHGVDLVRDWILSMKKETAVAKTATAAESGASTPQPTLK